MRRIRIGAIAGLTVAAMALHSQRTRRQRVGKLDFDGPDLADEGELNEILWLAIKGTPPPAPVRSWFRE
jgi:hypothetical protein